MFDRFVESTRQVVVQAQEESRALRHNYIGTEHLLLGLLRTESAATDVLTAAGFTLDGVRAQVADRIGLGDRQPRGRIPFTPRTKKVLELSLEVALGRGHSVIAPGHLLLAIIREGEGVAAQILASSADLRTLSESAEGSVRRYTGVALPAAVGRTRRRGNRVRRAAGVGYLLPAEEPSVDVSALIDRLRVVEDGRLEEAKGRAAAEARLERLDAVRHELERARDEIAELRRLLTDAGIDAPPGGATANGERTA